MRRQHGIPHPQDRAGSFLMNEQQAQPTVWAASTLPPPTHRTGANAHPCPELMSPHTVHSDAPSSCQMSWGETPRKLPHPSCPCSRCGPPAPRATSQVCLGDGEQLASSDICPSCHHGAQGCGLGWGPWSPLCPHRLPWHCAYQPPPLSSQDLLTQLCPSGTLP